MVESSNLLRDRVVLAPRIRTESWGTFSSTCREHILIHQVIVFGVGDNRKKEINEGRKGK